MTEENMRLQELIDTLIKLKESQMNTAFTNVSNVSIQTNPMRQIVLEGVNHLREIELEREIRRLEEDAQTEEQRAIDAERIVDELTGVTRDQAARITALEADNDRLSIELRTLKTN